jgi:hypothetical protein
VSSAAEVVHEHVLHVSDSKRCKGLVRAPFSRLHVKLGQTAFRAISVGSCEMKEDGMPDMFVTFHTCSTQDGPSNTHSEIISFPLRFTYCSAVLMALNAYRLPDKFLR